MPVNPALQVQPAGTLKPRLLVGHATAGIEITKRIRRRIANYMYSNTS